MSDKMTRVTMKIEKHEIKTNFKNKEEEKKYEFTNSCGGVRVYDKRIKTTSHIAKKIKENMENKGFEISQIEECKEQMTAHELAIELLKLPKNTKVCIHGGEFVKSDLDFDKKLNEINIG